MCLKFNSNCIIKISIRSLLKALDPDAKISSISKHEKRIPEAAYDFDVVDVDKVSTCTFFLMLTLWMHSCFR